ERLPPAHVDVAGRIPAEVVRRIGTDQVDAGIGHAREELPAVTVPQGRVGGIRHGSNRSRRASVNEGPFDSRGASTRDELNGGSATRARRGKSRATSARNRPSNAGGCGITSHVLLRREIVGPEIGIKNGGSRR